LLPATSHTNGGPSYLEKYTLLHIAAGADVAVVAGAQGKNLEKKSGKKNINAKKEAPATRRFIPLHEITRLRRRAALQGMKRQDKLPSSPRWAPCTPGTCIH
jgi:hypothetical protein